MCLILDANRAGKFFAPSPGPDDACVWAWLERGGKLVFGGHLADEIQKVVRAQKMLVELKRSGKAHRAQDEAVRAAEAGLVGVALLSNDKHVVALALATRTRRLFSDDQALTQDFTNPAILSKPRGKVYNRAAHAHLLAHTDGCPGNCAKSSRRHK